MRKAPLTVSCGFSLLSFLVMRLKAAGSELNKKGRRLIAGLWWGLLCC